jgi:hypothetical protein
MHLSPRCGAKTRGGTLVSVQRCRTAGAGCTEECRRAPKGNRNAFKHGIYTAEAIARRRKAAALLRAARKLIRAERES